jgi:toxin-antitoxin system PIN domain toxin
MTAYLLDVNLLIALCDPQHMHHELAHEWFAAKGRPSWATCPITENGFVRVVSHPGYPNSPGRASWTAGVLRAFCSDAGHRFWPDSVSLTDEALFRLSPVLSASQITDVYLLGVAVKHNGALATLDRSIPAACVAGGDRALEVISP